MARFKVKNFEKFQHYKDRSPPWIKLYNDVLEDYAFGSLPDASKAHLLAIWLLASRTNNSLPHDAEWISKRINATEPVDLGILIAAGFLISDQPLRQVEQGASKPLHSESNHAMPETEGEGETEGDTVASQRAAATAPPEPDLTLPACLDRSADLKTQLFGPCLAWLARQSGKSEGQLRSLIGRWLKDWGDGAVLEAFTAAERESPVDPVAWITKALESRNGKRTVQKPTANETARAGIAAGVFGNA